MPMAITDPRLDDNPMVFVNDAFCALSGYEREELIGRNLPPAAGPGHPTRRPWPQVRQALRDRAAIDVDLLNYRKDGAPFWNALHINPVFSADGELHYFFASQYDVTARREALAAQTMLVHEVDHRVKNNLQIITALLAMEAKGMPDPDGAARLRSTMGRVEALSIVHRRLYQSDDPTRFDVAEFVRDVVTNLVGRARRRDLDVVLALEPAFLPANLAGPLALIVNEVVSDALRHAAPPGQGGRLAVEVASAEGGPSGAGGP
jgi:PAS domain S-box-containing protein